MGRLTDALSVAIGRKKALGGDDLGGMLQIMRQRQMPRRGTKEVLEAYRHMPFLRAVNHRIASAAASPPWSLWRHARRRGARSALRDIMAAPDVQTRAMIMSKAMRSGDVTEVEDHAFLRWFQHPNPKLRTKRRFVQVHQSQMDLVGTVYWAIERSVRGEPAEVWPFPASDVRQKPQRGTGHYEFDGLDYDPVRVPAENVIVLTDPDPARPFGDGAGIGHALGHELDADEEAAKTQAARFKAGGAPDLAFIDKEAQAGDLDVWEQSYYRKFGGGPKVRGGWFSNFGGSIEKLGYNFAELQLADLRKFERDVIAQVHGMPPELVGIIESSNRATIQGAAYLFAQWVLVPRLEAFRDDLWLLLEQFGESQDDMVLWYDSPVPEDREFHLEVMKSAAWAFAADEWRAMANHDELPEGRGSAHMVPFNLMPVEMARGGLSEFEATAGARFQLSIGKPPPGAEDPEWTAELRRGVVERRPSDATAEAIIARLKAEHIERPVRDLWDEELAAWMESELQAAGAEISMDVINPLIREHIEQLATQQIKGHVTNTTREQLRHALSEGIGQGEGQRELSGRVRRVFEDLKTWEARRIARTEVHNSAEFGKYHSWDKSALIDARSWQGSLRGDNREHHMPGGPGTVHGQERTMDKPFRLEGGESAGATAMWPGGFGIPAEDINCGCTQLPVVHDPLDSDRYFASRTKFLGDEMRRQQQWEDRAVRALRGGFDVQEREILEAVQQAFSGE